MTRSSRSQQERCAGHGKIQTIACQVSFHFILLQNPDKMEKVMFEVNHVEGGGWMAPSDGRLVGILQEDSPLFTFEATRGFVFVSFMN